MLNQLLQKKPSAGVAALDALSDAERLRLAILGASVTAFDWAIADDSIVWDGALNQFPTHRDVSDIKSGSDFLRLIDPAARTQITKLVSARYTEAHFAEIEATVAGPMGGEVVVMVATYLPGAHGNVERVTGLIRVISERVREVKRLNYLATRDELTGHLNRNALRIELNQAIDKAKAEERHCGFLVASIDRLAMINDTYGFDAADEVIMAAGDRLAHSLRDSDIIGRTAGNKFGVILGDCSEDEMAVVAQRLRSAVRGSTIDTRCGEIAATISVGAVWLPVSAESSQEAMLRAEDALERARLRGRDGFAVYEKSPQLETARLRMMSIADDVVEALKEKRLVLAYQPIVNAHDRQIAKYECLVRMIGRDGRVLPAGHFIPAAESLGLVHLIDRMALEMAVSVLKSNPGIRLGVNVSGTMAEDASWLQSFVDHVHANREVADRLMIELTETAALHHFEENAQFVSQLREMGCSVAIDDFGAGYTSFRNLQMMKIDMVKIDGAYVKGLVHSPENQVFVRTLLGLAKNFNLKTVAEWVGSEEEAQLLTSFGVDYFQGFYFGEPQLEGDWSRLPIFAG